MVFGGELLVGWEALIVREVVADEIGGGDERLKWVHGLELLAFSC